MDTFFDAYCTQATELTQTRTMYTNPSNYTRAFMHQEMHITRTMYD